MISGAKLTRVILRCVCLRALALRFLVLKYMLLALKKKKKDCYFGLSCLKDNWK